MKHKLIAVSTYGVEGILNNEIRFNGFTTDKVESGHVYLTGDERDIVKLNLVLACADRVYIDIGRFHAQTFDELFENMKKIEWEYYLPKNAFIHILAKSVKSDLFALSAIQSISKKAIVDRLIKKYGELPEDGDEYKIEVGLLNNEVTLLLDTSGVGLHKRGYRAHVGVAPLRETLAAAMIRIGQFSRYTPFIDPFCGSGTLPIEAALYATNTAPNMNRHFAFENFEFLASKEEIQKILEGEKEAARSRIVKVDTVIEGTDIDKNQIELSNEHAKLAGVDGLISFKVQDAIDIHSKLKNGVIVTNPPYGKRVGEDVKEMRELYKKFFKAFKEMEGWRLNILTSYKGFESITKVADKRRKLYNGGIECQLYQYQNPKVKE